MNYKDVLKDYKYGIIPFDEVKDKLLNTKNLKEIPPKAKSVILILFPYNLGDEKYKNANLARFAVPDDYHHILILRLNKIIKDLKTLYKDDDFVAFADNSPLPEKLAAALAGLGVIGKNTLLINKDYGSYFFIGEIVTTAGLEAKTFPVGECLNCLACLRACPSKALSLYGGIDLNLCLSAVSQKKGDLTEGEKALLKALGLVWGCDICQNVCPLNKGLKTTDIDEFITTAKFNYTRGDSIKGRVYAWRGEKVIGRNYDIINDDIV